MAATMLLVASPVAHAQNLVVLEWADQARDRTAIAGDPIYIRSLYCEDKQGPIGCDMTVVVLTRAFCPVVVQGYSFRTGANDLSARRDGDVIEVQVRDVKGVTKLRIRMITDLIGQKIVQQASGAITFHAMGDEAVRSAELIAFSKNSGGRLDKYPENLEVDLRCSKVSVTAAKKDVK